MAKIKIGNFEMSYNSYIDLRHKEAIKINNRIEEEKAKYEMEHCPLCGIYDPKLVSGEKGYIHECSISELEKTPPETASFETGSLLELGLKMLRDDGEPVTL